MKNRFLLLGILLPFFSEAQTFEKIDASVTGYTQGVNRPLITLKTMDGHLWFNSNVASTYRLYEYDGISYTYHGNYYKPSVSALRDIDGYYFAEANDGLIFTGGGQVYSNGEWSETAFKQTVFCQSQNKEYSYFVNFNLDTIFSYSNGAFVNSFAIALNQIDGLKTEFGGIDYREAAADNNGNIYFATTDNGLIRVNLTTKVATSMLEEELSSLRTVHVASNGNIYVGGSGFLAYYDSNSNWNVIYQLAAPITSLSHVNDIAEDPSGRIWITSHSYTLGNGFVARFDESDHTQLFDIITDTTANHEYIAERIPQALYIDNDYTFYFGVYQESYLLKVTDVPTLNINEFNASQKQSVFPNPSSDYITIEGFESGSVSIYNIYGQLIVDQKVNTNKINISNLSSGQYLIKYQNKNKEVHQVKFIKD